MKRINKFLLTFLTLGVILSCAQTPQRIELHPVYVIPRGTPEGPGLPLGVAEGLDTEKVKASTVAVVYGEGDSTMIGSGFFVTNDKIVTKIRLADFESDKGNIEEARSLYKTAIIDCGAAIELDAKNPYRYHTRGVAKAKLDDYNGAIEDFDKTINRKPDFARAYYNRALVKVLIGQKREAKADFKKAKELDADIGK